MKRLKLKVGKLYEVVWHDAYTSAIWKTPEVVQRETACVCKTVGYYVGRNKAGDVMLASTRGLEDDSCGGVSARPEGMIKKVRSLK